MECSGHREGRVVQEGAAWAKAGDTGRWGREAAVEVCAGNMRADWIRGPGCPLAVFQPLAVPFPELHKVAEDELVR